MPNFDVGRLELPDLQHVKHPKIGYLAYLGRLSGDICGPAGGSGLIVFLLILTEGNDVAQYVWGKSLGRHKIIPKISPNKTTEGFLGGLLTTMVMVTTTLP